MELKLTKDERVEVRFATRDMGDGYRERGRFRGHWTGEIDRWGKYTFDRGDKPEYRLFLDEIKRVDPLPETWVFTDAELKDPSNCRRDDMLLLMFDQESEPRKFKEEGGLYIFRNGEPANQYADGAFGVTKRDRTWARRAFREGNHSIFDEDCDLEGNSPAECNNYRLVRATVQGEFLAWV